MCGIAGIYGLTGQQAHDEARETIAGMNAALAHRGPDASGIWDADLELVLGHQRLSIIDTQEASNQPFLDAKSGDALVFNGEVYNYRELRVELEVHHDFQTDSDTEVVLVALQQWGRSALHRFNGMFAFAWWNSEQRELLLVRDRLGIKPLYYSESNGALLFASEIRSLLASNRVKREHDPVGLADYLRYQTVHAPRTILKDVKLLEPGHWIRLQGEEMQMEKWWDAAHEASLLPPVSSRKERTDRIRTQLKEAVRLRMRADVPLGAFLSGGIDSSAIVGLMQEVSEHQISTFSVTFNEGEFDESPLFTSHCRAFQYEPPRNSIDRRKLFGTGSRSSRSNGSPIRRWTQHIRGERSNEKGGNYGGFEWFGWRRIVCRLPRFYPFP